MSTGDGLEAVGDDTIIGDDGDDLIYGDALFTDDVAQALFDAGLLGKTLTEADVDALLLADGSGWEVFQSLENDTDVEWTRTDTINYILEHQTELALESTVGTDPIVGRVGGDDTISGGRGDEMFFRSGKYGV